MIKTGLSGGHGLQEIDDNSVPPVTSVCYNYTRPVLPGTITAEQIRRLMLPRGSLIVLTSSPFITEISEISL